MKPGKLDPSRRPSVKVFWSDIEKSNVITAAVDIQMERPDLAGLPLLREAMRTLPSGRRRKLIAVTQAPWFEIGVQKEIKRRAAEAKANADLLPVMKQNAASLAALAERQAAFADMHDSWRSHTAEQQDEMIGLLKLILAELRKFNSESPSRARAPTLARSHAN